MAAAGLIALEESPANLEADHANARYLAESLAEVPGIRMDLSTVRTNIVIFDISALEITTREFSRQLGNRNVLANGISDTHMRMVTHRDVSEAQCAYAIEQIREICESLPARSRAQLQSAV